MSYMASKIEIRMICQIDWCGQRCCCRIFARKAIIWQKFICNLSHYRSGIPLKTVWIDVGHNNFCANLIGLPIEFIKAYGTTMQLMYTIQIFINFIMLSVQIELSFANSIANTANRCSKIWIRR